MTRFFKVSLSVVALLLVALVLFTGCANKALTAAEEAKQAVEDATAELEAAIAKKADADELTAKVEELTAAVEAAKALVTDGDVALKAAIDEATKTLGDNAQTLISALDVKIAGLLAEKADKATINEQLAKLDTLVTNINAVTNGAISIKDFTELSTTVAYYAYRLEVLWEDNIVPYKSLYTDAQFTTLRKAYKNAETALYRATSMSVIEQAYANFEAVVSAKENRNVIDTLYHDTLAPFFKDAAKKSTKEAYDLYVSLKTAYEETYKDNELAKKALVGYYAGFFSLETTNDAAVENLIAKAFAIWGDKVNADVAELGNRYLVFSNASETYKNDAADIRTTRDYIEKFNGYVPSSEATPVAGEYDYVVALPNAPQTLKKVNDTAAFQANEARLDVLDYYAFAKDAEGNVVAAGADEAVEYITNKVLGFAFPVVGEDEAEKVLADITDEVVAAIVESAKNAEGTAMPTNEAVVKVNALKSYVDSWNSTFVKAPQAGESQANVDRYNANKAPIAEVEGVVNALYNYLYREGGAVATYKAEAQQFIDLVYVPGDIAAGIFDDHGNYDFANVKIYHGDMLDEAKELVTAWRNKWVGVVDLDVYDTNKVKVTASEAATAIMLAERAYATVNLDKVAEWRGHNTTENATLEAYYTVVEGNFVINETLPVAFIYETSMEAVLKWYNDWFIDVDDAKVTIVDIKYIADQLDETEFKPTEAYYELLNALVAKRTEMREALAAEAAAIQAEIDAIKGNSVATHLGEEVSAPEKSPLVAALEAKVNAYKAKGADRNLEEYVFVLVNEEYLADAQAEYVNILALARDIKIAADAVVAAEVEGTGAITENAMKTLIANVQEAIRLFVEANGADENYTLCGTTAIANGAHKLDVKAAHDALTNVVTLGEALEGKVTALNAEAAALNAATGDLTAAIIALGDNKGITADAYKAALDALKLADAKIENTANVYEELAGYDVAYNGGVEAANAAADAAYYAAIAKLVKAHLATIDGLTDKAEAEEFVATIDLDKPKKDSILADIATYYAEAVAKIADYTFTDAELQALVDGDITIAGVAEAQRAETAKAFQNAVIDEVWVYGGSTWADIVAATAELV